MLMSSAALTLALARSRRITLGEPKIRTPRLKHAQLRKKSMPASTGKRSKEGALQDGVNSLVRYIKNNYLDGPRQDAYDLVTGAWVPRKGQERGWKDQRSLVVRYAPWVLLLALMSIMLVMIAPQMLEGECSRGRAAV